MRKTASIILLIILVFNMVGYRAWFYYAEKKADASMEARLDKSQYDENDLITLTIPLFNPYQIDQKTFERVDGNISFQGRNYKFVKRKVSGGNLILRCIADNQKTLLTKAKTDFANGVNDLPGKTKNARSEFQKNFCGNDYIAETSDFTLVEFPASAGQLNPHNSTIFTDVDIAAPCKPPKSLA